MKINQYHEYYPAVTIFAGAMLGIVGLLLGSFYPANLVSSWLLYLGSISAACGALWAAHQQIQLSRENKLLNQKIIDLQTDTFNQLTGGESFCYAYPIFNLNNPDIFNWGFIHSGDVPISEVLVRIHNLHQASSRSHFNHSLGTLLPGKILTTQITDSKKAVGSYNFFFVAKNGSWTQEIRWFHLNDGLATANRVVRDGEKLNLPLHYEISKNYPEKMDPNEAWNVSNL